VQRCQINPAGLELDAEQQIGSLLHRAAHDTTAAIEAGAHAINHNALESIARENGRECVAVHSIQDERQPVCPYVLDVGRDITQLAVMEGGYNLTELKLVYSQPASPELAPLR
jgi:hypothetical protein